MNYVAYDKTTGKIIYFYGSSGVISEAPDGLGLLQVASSFTSDCINTHRVQDEVLVPVE